MTLEKIYSQSPKKEDGGGRSGGRCPDLSVMKYPNREELGCWRGKEAMQNGGNGQVVVSVGLHHGNT